ncbi:MAG TPA: hypothetical protein VF318_04230 [Dehalococcoidales bacterium]
MSIIDNLKMYSRFALGLRGFFKEPITLAQAEEIIRQRLRNREHNLLLLVKRAIYDYKISPYLKLLELAGCEYGDFENIVRSDGIEPALKKLALKGVYISIEEFKGKKEVTRGGNVFKFKESDFDNPFLSRRFESYSSASRSSGTRTTYDFEHLKDIMTLYKVPMLDAYGAWDIPFALWSSIMPGTGPAIVLAYTKAGKTPVRWFSPVEKRGFKPSLKNRMATSFIVYMGRLSGAKLPRPEYVSLDEAWRVAQWIAGAIKQQGGCCFSTNTSMAVRICQASKERGLDLTGTKFFLSGEPTTEAKRKEIESAGAAACPMYGFVEAGFVGLGCFSPAFSDDVHLCKDSFALIQQRREVPHAATSVEAFLFSTLLPSAPKILLNVESGDWGVLETRSCGCRFDELGFTDHIHSIRGFDKLTGEGMTFIGTDLVRIIEAVLPAKFGGASTDYQMVEEEDEQGHTRMSPAVSPRLGPIDEAELVKTVLTELSKGKDTQRMMADIWSRAHTLRIKRVEPFATGRGKLMPLHIGRRRTTSSSG